MALPIALNTTWTAGTGDWSTGANWDNGEPGAADTAIINNGGTAQITQSGETANIIHLGFSGIGTIDQTGGTNNVSNMILGTSQVNNQGTYNLSGTGTLTASTEIIGNFGIGIFNQSGGTHTVSTLVAGQWSSGNGTYNLNTGNLSAFNEVLGVVGSGIFNHSGGTNDITNQLDIGQFFGSNGTYTISGGTLDVSGSVVTGAGTGVLNIDGGTVNAGTIDVDTLNIANSAGTTGSHTLLSGESITTGSETIGSLGTGTFIQTGGTHTVSSGLQVGVFSGSDSTYDLSGTGNLTASSEFIGLLGTGTFTQTGGTNTVTNSLAIGVLSSSSGAYNLSGTGSLSAVDETIAFEGTGTFTQAGGTNTVTNNLFIGNSGVGNGTYTISGGTLDVGNSIVNGAGTGTLNIDGGTVSAGTMGVDFLNVANTAGTIASHILGSGESISTFQEVIGNNGTGVFTQSGGTNTLSGGLWLGNFSGSNGTYDLNSGALSSNTQHIGARAIGTFTQSGGTNSVSTDLYVGNVSGSNGTYNLSGTGNLTALNESISNLGGTGNFTQTGGTNSVTNNLFLGKSAGGSGTYNVSGGSFSANNSYIGGSSTASGGSGTMNVSGAGDALVSVALKLWDAGVVNLSGGMLSAGTIDNTNGGSFNMTGGTLAVDSFSGNLVNMGGTLAPGNSPGTTTISGNYSQDINSTLQIEIGGLTAGTEFDVFNVLGNMDIGGTLEVLLYGGFNPLAGDTFDILNWGSLTGVFDSFIMPTLLGDLIWDTSALYTTGELSVAVTAVPEPATVALLGIGLAGLGGMYLRRRRRERQADSRQ